MSRTQQDSDVQEDGEESMEGMVTYDCIIIAEIELDGCSRGGVPQEKRLEFQVSTREIRRKTGAMQDQRWLTLKGRARVQG
jgi:hypothetical protein